METLLPTAVGSSISAYIRHRQQRTVRLISPRTFLFLHPPFPAANALVIRSPMRGRVETKTTAATSPLSFCQSSAGRCSLCLSLFLSSSCHHPGDGPLDSFLIGKILSLLFFSVQPNKSRERERCLSRTGRNEEGNEYKSNQSVLLVV